MLQNPTLAVAVAWFFNYLFSMGKMLSSLKPAEQSLASFTAACMAWTSVMISAGVVCLLGAGFMPLRFVSSPDRQPTWWRCIGLLIRRTYRWYIFSASSAVGVSYVFSVCSPSAQKWKLHFYVGGSLVNVFSNRALQASRRNYQLETVEGLARGVVDVGSYWSRLRATYLANMQVMLSVYAAAAYVHGSSQLHLHTNVELLAFSGVSLVVKLLAQEAAMRAVMQRSRSQVNRMYISVALPTVLIDTQVRIVLLRATANNATQASFRQVHVWGSKLLAIIEIVLRVGKVWWIHVTIGRRWRQHNILKQTGSATASKTPGVMNDGSNGSSVHMANAVEDPFSMFEIWWKQRLRFHAAEVQADMNAEYIAIGCSLSIYHFYHAHPKYNLSEGVTEATGQSIFSATYAQYVFFQVVLEIGVDFVCSMIEITAGVPCKVPLGSGAFVAAVFIFCAGGNIAISSAMYLVNDDGQ